MADGTIVLNQLLYGQVIQNVLVFNNMVNNPTFRQEAADELRASFAVNVNSHMDDGWSLQNVTFQYNDVAPIFSVDTDFTNGILTGQVAGGSMPTQSSLLVSTLAIGNPPNRGRIYFGGISRGNLDADSARWEQAALDSFETMVTAWTTGIALATQGEIFLRIARRDAAGIITLTSGIEEVRPRDIPAGQSRRRIGRGV